MFIKKIRIENFRAFEDITIDFNVNKNGIEKDLVVDRFKLIDDKMPIPSVTALVGRNSVGKTTILRSLSLLKDIENNDISRGIIDSMIYRKLNLMDQKHIQINGMSSQKIDITEFQKEKNELISEIKNQINKRQGIHFKEYIYESSKWFSNFFQNNSHNPKKETIQFTIEFIENDGKVSEYSILINDDGNIQRHIKGNIELNQVHNYFKNVFAPLRIHSYEKGIAFMSNVKKSKHSSYYEKNNVELAISSLMMNLGSKNTIKLIKLADEDIIGIKHIVQKNGIIVIENIILPESKVAPRHLSQGTKQFIVIAEAITRAFKINGENGLILIDEIESNIHNELIIALLNMLINLFKKKNFQSIITTHNLYVLPKVLSTKQIISIQKNNGSHNITRLSSIMKPHESIGTKYENGLIASYPDTELIRNTMADILSEL